MSAHRATTCPCFWADPSWLRRGVASLGSHVAAIQHAFLRMVLRRWDAAVPFRPNPTNNWLPRILWACPGARYEGPSVFERRSWRRGLTFASSNIPTLPIYLLLTSSTTRTTGTARVALRHSTVARSLVLDRGRNGLRDDTVRRRAAQAGQSQRQAGQ